MGSDPVQDDELEELAFPTQQRSRVPAIVGGMLALVLVGIGYLYTQVPQRGLSLGGAGHITVLPNGETWVFFLDGAQVRATPETARRVGAQSGPCSRIDGALKEDGPLFEIDALDCTPGKSVVPRITERMGYLGLRFGYWPMESTGQSLAEAALTSEIVAAMIDPRTDNPQIVPLYNVLFPQVLSEIRAPGGTPPLIIHVDRHDLVTNRMDREQLGAFLQRPQFILAGAGTQGGWLIRTVKVDPKGVSTLESLLVNPAAEPWTTELRNTTLSVGRKQAGASFSGGQKG